MTLADQLSAQFPDITFQPELPLAPLTYFKVGGPAEAFAKVDQPEQVVALSTFCSQHDIALTMLGGASNVIVADQGLRGLVLRLTNNHIEVLPTTIDSGQVGQSDQGNQTDQTAPAKSNRKKLLVGAGTKTALAVKAATDAGLTGLEYFLGVPGSVGGAIYNNAHYLQDLIGEHVSRVQVVSADHQLRWLSQQECQFGYDASRFQSSPEIIVQVEFELAAGDSNESQQLIAEATRYRAETQPLGEPSSGCIFQNVKLTPQLASVFPQFAEQGYVPSGYLIDHAGLKDTTIGGIAVSSKHAAFFINTGSGTAGDARRLIELVKTRVRLKFGVELQEEVFYLGDEDSESDEGE